jgi:endonuclease-3
MKKNNAKIVTYYLDTLFPSPPIPLTYYSLYTLLIAVLLSARCTDKKVNEITPILFDKADTPEQMIKLSVDEIRNIIKPCGLSPTKAKAIKNLSHMLLDNYQGKVPDSLEELEKLPGVGRKTASVVMIQGFNKPALPVDTHIHRCAKRWGLSLGKTVQQTEKDLKEIFPKSSWNNLHLQIIYYARTHCPAKKHTIDTCPICKALHTTP